MRLNLIALRCSGSLLFREMPNAWPHILVGPTGILRTASLEIAALA